MTRSATDADSYVLFDLAGATYALRSTDVVQLEMAGTPTPVPNAPSYVDGVVSVRGQVIPTVSLRARFGFPRVAADLRSRLIVVRASGRTVGLAVDSAREFANIAPGDIGPLPEGIGALSGRYLRGVARQGERLLLVLDVAELLAHDVTPLEAADPADPAVPADPAATSEPPAAPRAGATPTA